jgi:hypothetical protein
VWLISPQAPVIKKVQGLQLGAKGMIKQHYIEILSGRSGREDSSVTNLDSRRDSDDS